MSNTLQPKHLKLTRDALELLLVDLKCRLKALPALAIYESERKGIKHDIQDTYYLITNICIEQDNRRQEVTQ